MNLPYQFREIEMEEYKKYLYTISYNGVDVIVNSDKNKFNATELMKDICLNANNRYNQWRKGRTAKILIEPGMEIQVNGCRDANGKYLDWSLFYIFVYSVSPIYGARWLMGDEDWSRPVNEGYIYLVQPQDKLGTDIYKIGRTWNCSQRFRSYGRNVDVICRTRVDDMFTAEKIMIAYFEGKFDRAVRDGLGVGEEYFHIKSRNLAKESFKKGLELC